MFNGLKIKTNSIKLSSFFGGAAIAAATLALTGNALPASAASITYSNWANIGPQRIGDADNGKFTLKVTDGEDVGAAGKALFQFTSVSLAAKNLISEVYFNDASGLFKKDTTVTPIYSKGKNPVITGYDTTFNYQPYASVASTTTPLKNSVTGVTSTGSTSINGLDFVYNANITLPQGNAINVQKPNFGFNRNGGNTNSISVGETLGILVDLADGKDFTSVLNALTQTNGLIVAAHIIGYDGALSDGFYYGNPGLTTTPPAGTDSAIFYDSYKTPTDPNPDTRTTAPAPVPAAVPEPLTILGAATAAGFGASFKRRLAKVKGNQKAD